MDAAGHRDRGQERREQPPAPQHGAADRSDDAGESVAGRGHGLDGRSSPRVARRLSTGGPGSRRRAGPSPSRGGQSFLVLVAAAGLLSDFDEPDEVDADSPDVEEPEDEEPEEAGEVDEPEERLSVR